MASVTKRAMDRLAFVYDLIQELKFPFSVSQLCFLSSALFSVRPAIHGSKMAAVSDSLSTNKAWRSLPPPLGRAEVESALPKEYRLRGRENIDARKEKL